MTKTPSHARRLSSARSPPLESKCSMAVTMVMMRSVQGLLPMLFVLLVVGVPLAWSGLRVRRTQLLEASERARAEAEMADLQREVEAAKGRGGVTHRMLAKRGYTSPKIRRWIALECGVVLPDREL